MKLITFEDIKSLNISPHDCYEMARSMIKNKNDALLPEKTHMNMPEGIFCNVMPSILHLKDSFVGGVKIITRYPRRTPSMDSMILIFDAASGEFLALMDGNWITAMRTGAVAAHSILQFAKKGFSDVGIIGLGNTARAALLILSSVLDDRKLNIKLLRYKNQADLFMDRFSRNDRLNFCVVDSPEQTVRGSDVVISCATYLENDICPDDCFDAGVTVVPVHTRGFTNCDLFFDRVYADDTGHVDHFNHFGNFKYYAEVSDVVNGKSVGRESDEERILVYNIGISVHDINYAACVYQMMKDCPEIFNRLGDIDIDSPVEKFWV